MQSVTGVSSNSPNLLPSSCFINRTQHINCTVNAVCCQAHSKLESWLYIGRRSLRRMNDLEKWKKENGSMKQGILNQLCWIVSTSMNEISKLNKTPNVWKMWMKVWMAYETVDESWKCMRKQMKQYDNRSEERCKIQTKQWNHFIWES